MHEHDTDHRPYNPDKSMWLSLLGACIIIAGVIINDLMR